MNALDVELQMLVSHQTWVLAMNLEPLQEQWERLTENPSILSDEF